MTADDEIRIIKDAARLLGADVAGRLWSRGWAIADQEARRGSSIVWYWPPTAPAGYRQRTDDDGGSCRETPWTAPTRLTRTREGWYLEYGSAVGQPPARPELYTDEDELVTNLGRIEWWPMHINEVQELRVKRIAEVTMALASDDHYRACTPTEPYASRLEHLREHIRHEHRRSRPRDRARPSTPRKPGDLTAQFLLADADAWVSAMRTARAGGKGWATSGPSTQR